MAPLLKRPVGSAAVQAGIAAAAVCAVLVTCGVGVMMNILSDLPPIDASKFQFRQSVQIQDRVGNDLYRIYTDEDRVIPDDAMISPYVRNAVVAIEDERFFSREYCVDTIGILRAALQNLRTGYTSQGASTITQQLVRSVLLTPEKSWRRKIREIVLACRMEKMYSKDEILTFYIHRVPFGGVLYGVERAAQGYFGISQVDLSLAQAAVLAAIPQRPTAYTRPLGTRTTIERDAVRALRNGEMDVDDLSNTDVNVGLIGRAVATPEGTVWVDGRADAVIRSMRRLAFISQEEADAAHVELRTLKIARMPHERAAPHFTDAVRSMVETIIATADNAGAWDRVGIRVKTTLDPVIQKMTEDVVAELQPVLERSGARHAAVVVLDRETRSVLGYVGNTDYESLDAGEVDMARAPRPVGSAFKPIVYAADMMKNQTHSGTFILDGPLQFAGAPRNFDGLYRGWTRIKNALGMSRNVPAVRAYMRTGEQTVLLTAASMGVTTPLQTWNTMRARDSSFTFGWPAALGSAETPLLQMVQAYAVIAEGGVYKPLKMIDSILDNRSEPRVAPSSSEPRQAIDSFVANELDEILRDPRARPEGEWRDILTIPGIDAGVKTGTSNICAQRSLVTQRCLSYAVNNAWTIGYDDRFVVGVWTGNADNAPLVSDADGLTVAAPIWRTLIERLHVLAR